MPYNPGFRAPQFRVPQRQAPAGFQGLRSIQERVGVEDEEEKAATVNPLNMAADAIGRFLAAGGPSNPLAYVAAASALADPIKGEEFQPLDVAGRVATTAAASSLFPTQTVGPGTGIEGPLQNTGFLETAGRQIGQMADPKNLVKTRAFLQTLKASESEDMLGDLAKVFEHEEQKAYRTQQRGRADIQYEQQQEDRRITKLKEEATKTQKDKHGFYNMKINRFKQKEDLEGLERISETIRKDRGLTMKTRGEVENIRDKAITKIKAAKAKVTKEKEQALKAGKKEAERAEEKRIKAELKAKASEAETMIQKIQTDILRIGTIATDKDLMDAKQAIAGVKRRQAKVTVAATGFDSKHVAEIKKEYQKAIVKLQKAIAIYEGSKSEYNK